jgi:hypothetical protein
VKAAALFFTMSNPNNIADTLPLLWDSNLTPTHRAMLLRIAGQGWHSRLWHDFTDVQRSQIIGGAHLVIELAEILSGDLARPPTRGGK